MARVIINGDDFGMNESCSRAIAQAFAKGLITDTTAVMNGEWIDEALQLARDNGFSDKIGVHLNLTEGKPLTERICEFTDFVTDGYFNKRAMTLNRKPTDAEYEAVYAELESQILRLKNAGIIITHADSHHYIHNSGYLFPVVAKVCRKYGIGKLRLRKNLPDTDPEINAYNASLRAQGFITTKYFGRPEEIMGGEIPDCTELLVHPDFDRDGKLIDRRGMSDGYPIGDRFPEIGKASGAQLIDYSLL